MSRAGVRPPPVADERTQLTGWLQLQRDVVRWKCEGLSDEDAHRVVLPGSPLMTMAGLLSHLRWTEHCWFHVLFLDEGASSNPQFDESTDEELDWSVPGVTLAQLLSDYEAECSASDAVIAAHDLDEESRNRDHGPPPTLRWILLHVLEETARHAGHADIVREQLDGRTGYW